MNFDETWVESRPSIDPVSFWCGSRIFFHTFFDEWKHSGEPTAGGEIRSERDQTDLKTARSKPEQTLKTWDSIPNTLSVSTNTLVILVLIVFSIWCLAIGHENPDFVSFYVLLRFWFLISCWCGCVFWLLSIQPLSFQYISSWELRMSQFLMSQ